MLNQVWAQEKNFLNDKQSICFGILRIRHSLYYTLNVIYHCYTYMLYLFPFWYILLSGLKLTLKLVAIEYHSLLVTLKRLDGSLSRILNYNASCVTASRPVFGCVYAFGYILVEFNCIIPLVAVDLAVDLVTWFRKKPRAEFEWSNEMVLISWISQVGNV